jgi:hypothetical protein
MEFTAGKPAPESALFTIIPSCQTKQSGVHNLSSKLVPQQSLGEPQLTLKTSSTVAVDYFPNACE